MNDAGATTETGSPDVRFLGGVCRKRHFADLPDDQWEELTTYLDVNDAAELTFKGFTALYSLQTGASASRMLFARHRH